MAGWICAPELNPKTGAPLQLEDYQYGRIQNTGTSFLDNRRAH